MSGALENIIADTLHVRSMGKRVGAVFLTFKTLPSIPDHYSHTPTLQYSNTPLPRPGYRGFGLVPRILSFLRNNIMVPCHSIRAGQYSIAPYPRDLRAHG